jgi:hypothetical protein
MIPVEAHLLLNHVPLIGLVFGLVFFVAGLMRASGQALRAGLRIFLAMGIAVLPVVGSGLVSASVLADATWLDANALGNHQLAGILTLVVLVGLGTLCGVALFTLRRNERALSVRVRNAVLLLAVVGFGANLWTAYLGGALRHSELGREQPGAGKHQSSCFEGVPDGVGIGFWVASEPSTHSPLIAPPLVAEISLQLPFFAADESIHQRDVQSGNDQRRWRSEQQRGSEKNEDIAAEIQRIPRKAIGARGDERVLWFKRDDTHVVNVEMECRPEAQEESEPQEKQSPCLREREDERGDAQKRIHHSAQVRDAEPHDDDADVVKSAFEKICGHSWSLVSRARPPGRAAGGARDRRGCRFPRSSRS